MLVADVDAGCYGAVLLIVAGSQEGGGQIFAAAAACGNAQLCLQVAQGGSAGRYGFFDLVIGNRVADTYKHDRNSFPERFVK